MRTLKRAVLALFVLAAFADYWLAEIWLIHSLGWVERYHLHFNGRGVILLYLWYSPTLFRFGAKGVLLFLLLWGHLPIFLGCLRYAKELERMVLGEKGDD
jgi:hypothetical protein